MRNGASNKQVMDNILFSLGGTIHRWHEAVQVTPFSARLRTGVYDPPLNARDLTPRD